MNARMNATMVEPKEQPRVRVMLDEQLKSVNELHEMLSSLESRLKFISVTLPTNPEKPSAPQVPANSLIDMLYERNESIRMAIKRVETMLNEIQI